MQCLPLLSSIKYDEMNQVIFNSMFLMNVLFVAYITDGSPRPEEASKLEERLTP